MRIASALSTLSSVPAIAQDIDEQLKPHLGTRPPDLLMLFVSSQLTASFEEILGQLRRSIRAKNVVAVTAESIIGNDQEVERTPAVSALTMSLASSKASIATFHLGDEEWPELLTDPDVLRSRLSSTAGDGDTEDIHAFVMLADPFTTPIVQLLDACSVVFPNAPVIGGMASGVNNPGDIRLAVDDALYSSGLVGIAFSGNIEIDCVVSQGCRPIGRTFAITKCHKNVIEQLDGRPALAAIEEMVQQLPLHDRQLLATGGLQIGRVIDEGKGNYGRGDFLIRSLVGVRRETNAILIGDMVRPGQTLQFHVRDAKTAEEEMRLLLEGETLLASDTAPPIGALLFTCNSRGTRFFDMPHHDITLTRQVLGPIPIAGFFAAGELGPVGQKNFIHGHTASLALFREPAS